MALSAVRRGVRPAPDRILLVGTEGVGKSTFSAQLAFALAAQGKEVGLMDLDICGPSIPKMLGLEGQEIHRTTLSGTPAPCCSGRQVKAAA